MKKTVVMRMCVIVSCIVLVCGINTIGVVSHEAVPIQTRPLTTAPGIIITVDDEPGDADYTLISEALSHATANDTIEVYSGTYNEFAIDISVEQVTLKGIAQERGSGDDVGKPIVDSGGTHDVFVIRSVKTTITGFIIQNASNGIVVYSSTNVITNNTIRNVRGDGLWLQGDYNTVQWNTFEGNDVGLAIYGCYFNTIRNNNFLSNQQNASFTIGNPGPLELIKIRVSNRWSGNYWNEPRIAPKIILGLVVFGSDSIFFIPMMNIDWRPASKPYQI